MNSSSQAVRPGKTDRKDRQASLEQSGGGDLATSRQPVHSAMCSFNTCGDHSHRDSSQSTVTETVPRAQSRRQFPEQSRRQFPEQSHRQFPEQSQRQFPEQSQRQFPEHTHIDSAQSSHIDSAQSSHIDSAQSSHIDSAQSSHIDSA